MKKPDLEGPCGKAWIVKSNPGTPAVVAKWIIYRPGAHAFWSYWLVSAITLQDLPNIPPAKIVVPGATHEIIVMSMNPDFEPNPDSLEDFHLLDPSDLIHQLAGLSDVDASRVVELYVKTVITGGASPDSDFRSWWKPILDKTAEHFRENPTN